MLFSRKSEMVTPEQALPGRSTPLSVSGLHASLGTPLTPPFPDGSEVAYVAMGCFWGAERTFYQQPGVYTTAVGYPGGLTPNPTYEEVCSGRTGHTEAVMVVFDPSQLSYERAAGPLLRAPRPHPGQPPGQRRGHPVPLGDLHHVASPGAAAAAVAAAYAERLAAAGRGSITTEVAPPGPSTTQRATTSSTSSRCPTATAASAAPG